MKSVKKAFSLIELMVVVAIIALLATIAAPRYFSYIAKAKQAEVATMLASLHTAQQLHWMEHGTYTTKLTGPDGIGWKPEGSFYYTYGFYFPGAREGVHYFVGKLGTSPEALGECFADGGRFLARAAGDVTKKNVLDIWSVDETRGIKHDKNYLISS